MLSRKKLIAIMQPTYMPWCGYFSMMDSVEEFVFLDTVQLEGRSWQVRNKIKLGDCEKMLTIPVKKELHRDDRMISNTRYDGVEWKYRHMSTIQNAYRKSEYYNEVYPFLEQLYSFDKNGLIGEFNINMISCIAERIGIDTPLLKSSMIGEIDGHKDKLLVNICNRRNATDYLSARGSAEYIEKDIPGGEFGRANIGLYYQNYNHPVYNQSGASFIFYIGIFDLLFNEGFENALSIIRGGEKQMMSSTDYRKIL